MAYQMDVLIKHVAKRRNIKWYHAKTWVLWVRESAIKYDQLFFKTAQVFKKKM